jgi:hypothetical protein
MVKKSEDSQDEDDSKDDQSKDRLSARIKKLNCVGNICFNVDTGKLEIELNRKSCPPDVIKSVVERIVKGVEVEFVVPKKPIGEKE